MKKLFTIILILIHAANYAQGLDHNFLFGYTGLDTNVISKRAVLGFDQNQIIVNPDSFKMAFGGVQANISDQQGNLLMYTNGCWIANASGDTMQNGGGLNPGAFANAWCQSNSGMPIPNSDVFLPWPGDSSYYILLHQTSTDSNNTVSTELFYSIIDITQNGGLGAVTQKNVIAIQGLFCPGFGVCKHANGRDWWIVLMSPVSDTIYKLLLTPTGLIPMPSQASGLPMPNNFIGTIQFSPDGNKFGYNHNYYVSTTRYHQLRLLDFDRCSGMFSNPKTSTFPSPIGSTSITFSSNSKYVYYGTFNLMLQANADTTNLDASVDTVAIKDNYCYPFSFTCANFFEIYRAANGKIYACPNSGIDLTYINQPDSEGISCDVHLHALRMPCYISRNHVFHPNYYLGPVIGSACDSLHVGLNELEDVRNVNLYPNPSHDGIFSISYLLPQNKSGILKVFDLMGKEIFKMNLPQWSTLQNLSLPFLTNGVYNVFIYSGESSLTKRLIILK